MSLLFNYTQIVGHLLGLFRFYAHTLALVLSKMCSFSFTSLRKYSWPSKGFVSGVSGWSVLSLFQSSFKNFKGRFFKIWSPAHDDNILEGFPLYLMSSPHNQQVRRKEDLDNSRMQIYIAPLKNFKISKIPFDHLSEVM